MGRTREVRIEERLAGLDAGHEAALEARAELLADLRAAAGLEAHERALPAEGTKGVATELVIGLSGAGSVGAFAQIVKAWLGRDRRRSLTVTVTESANGKVVRVEGDTVSNDALIAALNGQEQPTAPSAAEEEPTGQA
ncbi:hypothetical protein AB0M28_17520 [Streptomyces sp. NPDC051940]|uniref:effector-associated constant component EACC1 n=1 Tax=Streptomyces sp. NPDC051940 TaxID=3155675 RepID=UPI00342D7D0E